jgi:hypothetical protein
VRLQPPDILLYFRDRQASTQVMSGTAMAHMDSVSPKSQVASVARKEEQKSILLSNDFVLNPNVVMLQDMIRPLLVTHYIGKHDVSKMRPLDLTFAHEWRKADSSPIVFFSL